MSESFVRFQAPGAQVPPVTFEATSEGGMTASMDAAGNVRLEATLTPDDRAVLRKVAQEQAATHADRIGNPGGLRGLFPTNNLRWTTRRSSTPIRGR